MAEADLVTIKANGQLFSAWTRVEVSKGIDTVAGAWSVEYAERPELASPPRIRRGDACQVLVGGELVISGWVDVAAPQFDPDKRTLSVHGRDRAGDLVECAALNTPGVWRGRTLLQIAADLVKPFGIKVSASASVGEKFKTFSLQQGETAWDAIERLARFRGLLATSTAGGDVEFIIPGRRRAGFTLRQGVHLISASLADDGNERFSRYVLKGQSAGDDDVNGRAAAGPKAEAKDPGVTRYRPTLILGEEHATIAGLQARAKWEAAGRAARGYQVELVVQGWRDPMGALWSAGQLVGVEAPWIDVSGDLLIADVTFSLTPEQGSTTRLRCAPPEAYKPEPLSGATK